MPKKVGFNEGYSDWYNTNSPNPNVHVGAVVGGPDFKGQFKDVRSDYSHLEPTTFINAVMVGCLAGILQQIRCSAAANFDIVYLNNQEQTASACVTTAE